jgi:hypothetical protein
MKRPSTKRIATLALASFSLFLLASSARCEEPVEVSICTLKENPTAYNHTLIRLTGFVSHGFEDFTLLNPECPDWPEIWLEYGGTRKSGTVYCCGASGDRGQRSKQLEVENLSIPLIEDGMFSEFDRTLHDRPYTMVHATLVGRFFAGNDTKDHKNVFRGYGHMGCCSLLVIQQILQFDRHDRSDLDYSLDSDEPHTTKVGCYVQDLLPTFNFANELKAQKFSDDGARDWTFVDPKRVATESLAGFANVEPINVAGLRQKGSTRGRFVYEWKSKTKKTSYTIVISRPYWLSFYARNPEKVAWVTAAAYKAGCDSEDQADR